MKRPKIFISHISEETELANELKIFIEEKFLNALEVFSSSSDDSIQLGDEWVTVIKNSIEESKLIILLCSPISILRPWINFEAGAGWIKNVPVIPMCHSGLEPRQLPFPISIFHGGKLNKEKDIEKLFKKIAEILFTTSPKTKDEEFENAVLKFEKKVIDTKFVLSTEFVKNLFHNYIIQLKYHIVASTTESVNLNKIDIDNFHLDDHTVEFNKLQYLFEINYLGNVNPKIKVFEKLKDIIIIIIENIKFVLSYNSLEIDPKIKEQLDIFLFFSNTIDLLFDSLTTIDNSKYFKKQMLEMIIKEPFPPSIRLRPNLFNYIIGYYKIIEFYKNWIIEYENRISEILNNE